MVENVPALAFDERINMFTSELKKLGYHIDDNSVLIEDASKFGVPQRRKRMVLLASRYGELTRAQKNSNLITVRDAIGHLARPENSNDPLHNILERRTEKVKKN
ncbi:DNA cytosine methyltransferase [Escherichia coli]|nr:DNA cytosine methyltransferase [Escherichia coli]